MTNPNGAIVTRFMDQVLNQGQYDDCDQIVAEDFIELNPLPGQTQGRQGLKDIVAMLRAAFAGMHWVAEETIAEADKVVTRFTWTGTHQGAFMRIPPTGREVKVKGVAIDRIVDGRMTDSRLLMDTLSLLQQLCAIPA
jgi:steroid delta-isomerase-like uncharacterized protein